MPGPAVYVVAIVGAAVVGFALKEFVFDPFVRPHLAQWREETRARREANRRRRQPVSPHTTHEAAATGSMSGSSSIHEMEDLGRSATESSSSTRNFPTTTSSGIRMRRSNAEPSNVEDVAVQGSGLIDIPNDNNIPITPLAPEPSPWSSVQAPRSPTLSPSRSPFELGSESPMTLSSPKSGNVSLSDSLASPAALPRIQLPTPSDSDVEIMAPSSPETHHDPFESGEPPQFASTYSQLSTPSASSAALSPETTSHELHPDLSVYAPPISRTTTGGMSASFVTAQSPSTDFRSFPPTEPTSPFSETFTFSGDEDMYSLPSRSDSNESLPVFAVPGEERGRGNNDGLTFVVGNPFSTGNERAHDELSDSLSEASGDVGSSGGFSDESWSEFSAPPTSPRH
ncbi:hypothetical protein ACEPAI_5609 [Sanghuangporus weigelae]